MLCAKLVALQVFQDVGQDVEVVRTARVHVQYGRGD